VGAQRILAGRGFLRNHLQVVVSEPSSYAKHTKPTTVPFIGCSLKGSNAQQSAVHSRHRSKRAACVQQGWGCAAHQTNRQSSCTATQLLPNADELLRRCPVQIATAAQLEPATRSLAAECLVTLCEARDKVSEAPARLMSLTSELPSN
jgi:hypothetical protein